MFDGQIRVEKKSPLPRHAQVKRILRELVASGRLRPGDKIPAEVEIADRLGVSKMTVNKALLALTGEGIFIREVGRGTFVAPSAAPQPNGNGTQPMARRLRVTLPFVQSAAGLLETDYYGSLYRAICETLAGRAVEVTLSPVRACEELEAHHGDADGWIAIAPRAESIAAVEALRDAGKAVVVIGASWPGMRVSSVDSDNVGGAMEAVRHLAALGHRRIALLYTQAQSANTQDRIVGYRRALSALNLPYAADCEIESELDQKTGKTTKRLRDLFQGPAPVTAVFAAGYHLALEAMNLARDANRRVPEEVSVVGYDDPLSAQLVYPPLTTIRQPLDEMGRRAAERVLSLLDCREAPAAIREVLPVQLVVRSSSVAVDTAQGQ